MCGVPYTSSAAASSGIHERTAADCGFFRRLSEHFNGVYERRLCWSVCFRSA